MARNLRGVSRSALGIACALTVLSAVEALAQTATETVLHRFQPYATNGAYPYSGVVRDQAGNLYGTTYEGGAANLGVVYEQDTAGLRTVLHSFAGGADGAYPQAGMILDGGGNLYGTTPYGGTQDHGIVFKLDPRGHETVLYNFTGKADGGAPFGGVIRDPAGNLYGTALAGGANGLGVVFRLDTGGHLSVLHNFKATTDGAQPFVGLIRDPAGNLFGTSKGGAGTAGVIYKVDTAGNFTVLHSFTNGADGGGPNGALFLDSAGNLYGTTMHGGRANVGLVFKLDSLGQETVLHSFTGGADGGDPSSGVVLVSGNLYGTTSGGGSNGSGVV